MGRKEKDLRGYLYRKIRKRNVQIQNRKGNKKDEGNYIAIAVARFAKIAIANLAIAREKRYR